MYFIKQSHFDMISFVDKFDIDTQSRNVDTQTEQKLSKSLLTQSKQDKKYNQRNHTIP